MKKYEYIDEIYANELKTPEDISNWRMEGFGKTSFKNSRMKMFGTSDPSEGQKANIVHWCDVVFPDNVSISWDFYPLDEPGLCILFFAAKGSGGQNVFSDELAPRSGPYGQYHSGDINTLHVSYFRRKFDTERAFNVANLRKSSGFHLVSQGADPIPSVQHAMPPYKIEVIKADKDVQFNIGHAECDEQMLEVFSWSDDGEKYGPVLTGGQIGFRQMTPMIAEYANLSVKTVRKI